MGIFLLSFTRRQNCYCCYSSRLSAAVGALAHALQCHHHHHPLALALLVKLSSSGVRVPGLNGWEMFQSSYRLNSRLLIASGSQRVVVVVVNTTGPLRVAVVVHNKEGERRRRGGVGVKTNRPSACLPSCYITLVESSIMITRACYSNYPPFFSFLSLLLSLCVQDCRCV